MLKLAYGYQVQENSDHMVHLVDQAMETLALATTPGVWLVDLLPILRYVPKWFPGATFQKKGAEWRKILTDTAHIPYEMVKANMVSYRISCVMGLNFLYYVEGKFERAQFYVRATGDRNAQLRDRVQYQVVRFCPLCRLVKVIFAFESEFNGSVFGPH